MERLVKFGAVLAFACLSHTSAQHSFGTVVVDDGRVEIGLIKGGNFGPKSFSIVDSPGERPKTQVYVNEDKGDVQDMVLQSSTNHKGLQKNDQPPRSVSEESDNSEDFNNGNTQLYPVKSLTNTNTGQMGDEDKKDSEAGQILIGAVVLNSNKHIKDSQKRNDNKQPAELDAAAIEAIFGSNGRNTGLPNIEKALSNTNEYGNFQTDVMTGGNSEEETLNINNNRKPGTNVLQKGSGVNNENTGNTNAGYEAPESKSHHAKNHGNAGVGGPTNSGYNSDSYDERWIWNR